jgi:hypothetical protein
MSGKGDFKFGDTTEIGLGTDVPPTLPSDANLGFWAAQEGNMGGLTERHGDAAQQQGEITVAVVQAGAAPAKADVAPSKKPQNLGGDFDFNDHTPVGGFNGLPNLDL